MSGIVAAKNNLEETAPLMRAVLDLVLFSAHRLTCRDVLERLGERYCLRSVKSTVDHLVSSGTLRYVNDCGLSFLEKNYIGRIRLAPHVWVDTRPGYGKASLDNEAVIQLLPGIAFGDCRHPTTRLAVRGIDYVLRDYGVPSGEQSALDIGTGSGILALVAAHLGVSRVLATDVDGCARKEARDNIRRNHMEARICVSKRPLEAITGRFSLIASNLRLPTLQDQATLLTEKLVPGGALVVSGFTVEESASLSAVFTEAFHGLWKAVDGRWCGLVFIKKAR